MAMEKITALLVEDDPEWQEALAAFFRDYEQIELKAIVSSAKDCHRMLEEQSFDIVLMDIMLDDYRTSGLDATLDISWRYPETKVIMLTSLDNDDEVFNEAFLNGAYEYIYKYDFEQLPSYVALSFYEPFWRLLVRGFLEPNFSWSYAGIGGTGMAGDYWVIAVIVALAIFLLFFGWRGGNRIVQWGIFVWVLLLFSSSLAIMLSDPKTTITAETLHAEIPYMAVFFLDTLLFIMTAAWMILFGSKNAEASNSGWSRANSVLLVIAVGLIPVEYVLFNGGEQHGLLDGVGVFVTFVQWVILNLALYPWKTYGVKAP
jgi:CheY-like chemotaxis protein